LEESKNKTKVENSSEAKKAYFSRENFSNVKDSITQKFKVFLPSKISLLKEKLADAKNAQRNWYFRFAKYSLANKLGFVGFIFALIFSGIFFYKFGTQGLFSKEEDMFIGSLEDWSQGKQEYDPKTEMESFYESTRTAQNIFLINKLSVNIKPSANSGSNPMAAFEFLVEGAGNDVVVELKAREAEMLDLFSRTIEEMTYDQLSTPEGKRGLCDRLRKEVNSVLSAGFVRKVFLKTVILKP
jgi:flagellar basal body-associated protein FliL